MLLELVGTVLEALEPMYMLLPIHILPLAIPLDCPPNKLIGPLFARIFVSPRKTISRLFAVFCCEELMVIPPPSPVAISDKALSASIAHASLLVPVPFPISFMASAVVLAEVTVRAP